MTARRWPKSENITVLETPCREWQGWRHHAGYGVSSIAICDINTGRTWGHLS